MTDTDTMRTYANEVKSEVARRFKHQGKSSYEDTVINRLSEFILALTKPTFTATELDFQRTCPDEPRSKAT